MRRFVACTACQRPHRADEAACPFCGQAVAKAGLVGDLVRTAKVGGLLAFTAVATAACYGAPPMPGTQPPPGLQASSQPPSEVVPSKAGTAFRFVTPKGGTKDGGTYALEKATLVDGTLELTGKNLDASDKFYVKIQATAADFEAKDRVFQAIDLEKVAGFEILWGRSGKGTKGTEAIKGTFQIKDVTDTEVSGTLLCEVDGTTIAIYFRAAR